MASGCREPASQPFCFRSQNIHDPLPFAPPPSTLLPGTSDGALSQCELHQDDEHRRENKLPSTLWSSRHGAISAAYSRTWLSSYGITNEVQCPAMSKPRRSSRNQRLCKITAVKTSHENELIAQNWNCIQGSSPALSHAKQTIEKVTKRTCTESVISSARRVSSDSLKLHSQQWLPHCGQVSPPANLCGGHSFLLSSV